MTAEDRAIVLTRAELIDHGTNLRKLGVTARPMTRREIQAALLRIKVRFGDIHVGLSSLGFPQDDDYHGEIYLRMYVRDRDKPNCEICLHHLQGFDRIESEERLCSMVRQACQSLILHELHEQFYFDDRRIYDPHVPGSPYETK